MIRSMTNDEGLPSSVRKGDWFQTYSGVKFYPYDPNPEDVKLEDIAHHLSLMCRFNGGTKVFYSVAQHSVLVSQQVAPQFALWGLLHDAGEAYVGDMVRPLKLGMRQFREVEALVMEAVALRFGLSLPEPFEVKDADVVLLYTERRDMLKVQRFWSLSDQVKLLPNILEAWSPREAEALFLKRYHQLSEVRNRQGGSDDR